MALENLVGQTPQVKNVGERIKDMADTIKVILMLLFIGCGIYLFFTGIVFNDSESSQIMIVTGIVMAVVGGMLTYILSLVLYGFGELIDQTAVISQSVNEMNKAMNGVCASNNTQSNSVKESQKPQVSTAAEANNSDSKKQEVVGPKVEEKRMTVDKTIKCPYCQFVQNKRGKFCVSCGKQIFDL